MVGHIYIILSKIQNTKDYRFIYLFYADFFVINLSDKKAQCKLHKTECLSTNQHKDVYQKDLYPEIDNNKTSFCSTNTVFHICN